MFYLIKLSLYIGCFDLLSIITTKVINRNIQIKNHPNLRWFFIHCLSNVLITYYSSSDLYKVLKNIDSINNFTWSDTSFLTFWISILTHIYHILFFKLTNDDILHHFSMVFIAGSLEYYQKSIICPAVLFFLSGLPGTIDYFCLYLVKVNLLNKEKEKIIYLYITTYFRGPGACILSFINIYNNYTNIFSILSSTLVFWNGQYYLMKTSFDYGKFYEKKKINREIWIQENKEYLESNKNILDRPNSSPLKKIKN